MEFAGEYNGTEEEIRKRPSFEDWCDKTIRGREDYVTIRMNVMYYAVMSNMSFSRQVLIKLSSENQGMKDADTPEFKTALNEWWYYQRKIMLLRSFVLRYFDIPPPNWKQDILPERLYCGVVLSSEDFHKLLTRSGSGMEVKAPESQDKYEADMKAKVRDGRENPMSGEFKEEEDKESKDDDEKEEAV